MGRVWKIIFALVLGVAATLTTGQIQSSQSDAVCLSTAGSCQATRWYGFPLAWRTLVSYTYPLGCTGPLEREACIQLYDPPPRYDLITFLLDTLFHATLGYGLISFARLSYRQLFARLPLWVPRPRRKWRWKGFLDAMTNSRYYLDSEDS